CHRGHQPISGTELFVKRKPRRVLLHRGFAKLLFKSVDQAATTERRDGSLSLPSFLSRERKRARQFAFFAELSFS
ncbi:MAG: hypothetical protein IKC89_00755, partial [Lentisphaeria bacterium]|nr:hypothetical protein [Lentisphaeria bacterium]